MNKGIKEYLRSWKKKFLRKNKIFLHMKLIGIDFLKVLCLKGIYIHGLKNKVLRIWVLLKRNL